MLVLGIDGNFCLKSRDRPGDDQGVNTGKAYFINVKDWDAACEKAKSVNKVMIPPL